MFVSGVSEGTGTRVSERACTRVRQYATNKTKLKQLRIKRLKRVVSAIAVRKIPVLSPVNA